MAGDPIGHLLDLRPQADPVHDQQHTRMGTLVLGTRHVRIGHALFGCHVDCGTQHSP